MKGIALARTRMVVRRLEVRRLLVECACRGPGASEACAAKMAASVLRASLAPESVGTGPMRFFHLQVSFFANISECITLKSLGVDVRL